MWRIIGNYSRYSVIYMNIIFIDDFDSFYQSIETILYRDYMYHFLFCLFLQTASKEGKIIHVLFTRNLFITPFPMIFLLGSSEALLNVSSFRFKAKRGHSPCYESLYICASGVHFCVRAYTDSHMTTKLFLPRRVSLDGLPNFPSNLAPFVLRCALGASELRF